MRCPVCQLKFGVECQAGEVVLTYSLKDRAQCCRYQRHDPVQFLKPTILELLQGNSVPKQPKPTKDE